MSTSIVILNVSQQSAPAPSIQQKKGAFISQGATTLAANNWQLLVTPNDLTNILAGSAAITTITWSGSVASVTTAAPHNIPNGQVVEVTVSGQSPAGYNGTFQATSTGANTFTYPLVSNPGAQVTAGVYTLEDVAELVAMNTTFWAQGSQQPVYVLELGIGDAAHGVAALAAYITANTVNGLGPFYRYLVPRPWAAEATFPALLTSYSNPASKTYFHVTATTGNYTSFTALMKAAFVMIEAPGIPVTEFSSAAEFYNRLNISPSATNKVVPARYDYLFGVTPYPIPSNQALIDTILAANVNLALTGAEGGLSNVVMRNGTLMDGRDDSYWYTVDWVQFNVDRNVSNAILNGSNNPQNPLYYNQDGINRLQGVIANTLAQAVSYGMVLGSPVQLGLNPADFNTNLANGVYAGLSPVNAQPFIAYVAANPSDFPAGVYNGFSVSFSPNRGFSTITISLNVTDFVVSG